MRNTKIITITDDNRDKGKAYKLTEKPAMQAEKWAARALLAIENSGVQLSDAERSGGMAALAAAGAQKLFGGKIDFREIEPLMDEMLECIQRLPNPSDPAVVRPIRTDQDDIEEISTLFRLRMEVLDLHMGFLPAAARSKLTSIMTPAASSSTPTSPLPSAQPSAEGM